MNLTERIIARFLTNVVVLNLDGCWIWQMYCNANGYGQFWVPPNMKFAHRVAYTIWRGPIPPDLLVCHKCDNPPCCNPEHLFVGTAADNHRDRNEKGRQARGERQGSAKLTSTQVEWIKEQYTAGRSSSEIAAELPVTTAHVKRILNGGCWAHLLATP